MREVQAADLGQVGLACLERSDGDALRRLFFRLSPQTIYRRFHSPVVYPDQTQPARLLDVDHHDREAVVAVVETEIVGVARYFRQPGADVAEVAVVVADDWQRLGLATRMFGALAELAGSRGVRRFSVTVQADNPPALALLQRFKPSEIRYSQGLYEAMVPIGAA